MIEVFPGKMLHLALEKMDSRFRGNDKIMSLLQKQESRQLNKGTLVPGDRLMLALLHSALRATRP